MDADVMVIGAGAAGLAAARDLARNSLRVIVVEARDRIGGRVYSLPATMTAVAELGAEFIHGEGAETMALLRAAGSVSLATGGDSWIIGDDGELERDEADFVAAAKILDKARSYATDVTVDEFLRGFEADAAMRASAAAARAFVEGFEAADPSIASARAIAEELHSGVDDTSARPLDGYPPVFAQLRKECDEAGVRFELSSIVQRIVWRPGEVAVHLAIAEGTLRVVRARAAIVTLPAGVLRGDDVRFEPDLPAAKRSALAHIEMGHVVKVALWFRTAFWEDVRDGRYRNAAFLRGAGGPFAAYWTPWPVRSQLISAWAGGPRATALQALPEAERIEAALRGFGALFGDEALARAEFAGGATHDWGRDPFARGAYSYVTVGGADARAMLALPVEDTVFFAGEATSTDGQGGTVNGALETGERAAREAAAALGATALKG